MAEADRAVTYRQSFLEDRGFAPFFLRTQLVNANLKRRSICEANEAKRACLSCWNTQAAIGGLPFWGWDVGGVHGVQQESPYLCIWLAARDLIAVAPDWTQARSVTDYGWIAFAFAVGGILIYFLA